MSRDPSVEEDILDRFRSLMQHAAGLHAPEFLGVDVTMPQAKVLYVVTLRPGVSMSVLASELGVGLPAISGLVDRLVAAGYLERREDPTDRRQQLVTVTAPGAAALDRLRELHAELMSRLLVGLSPTELEALNVTIDALDREVLRVAQQDLPSPAASDRRSRPANERTSA